MRPAVAIVFTMASTTSADGFVQLFAEAVHDEERVVHREPETDELDQVRDIEHHEELVCEEENDRERGEGRAGGHEPEVSRSATETPRTMARMTNATSDGYELALAQVGGQDRGDVVLEGGSSCHIGRGQSRYLAGRGGAPGLGRGLLQVERGADRPHRRSRPTARSAVACAVGTARAAATKRRSSCERVRADGLCTRKTTVKLPSTFSPKCWVKMASACSELVPGTASEVDNKPGKRPAQSTPRITTATQSAITRKRQRTTTRVQRSSIVARKPTDAENSALSHARYVLTRERPSTICRVSIPE